MGLFHKNSKKPPAASTPEGKEKAGAEREGTNSSTVPPVAPLSPGQAQVPENKQRLLPGEGGTPRSNGMRDAGQGDVLNDDGLRELTRKLKETQSSSYTESTQASSKYTDLRYAKFTLGGFPGVKHAVFIPDGLKLTTGVMEQICAAIDKEVPSMLLRGMSSLCHPAKMSTPQLRKCRGFRQLMNDSKSSLGIPVVQDDDRGGCWCSPKEDFTTTQLQMDDEELTNKNLIDVSDRVLEKKIASTISSVANAAFRTNVWTYSGPMVSNFEIFLQQCLDNGETDVFRLAVAHMQDKAYMESELSRGLMKYLFDNSQAMSPEVVASSSPVGLSGDLWNPSKCNTNREFAENGFDDWSFESCDEDACRGHPIMQWPWPYADLFFLFYREEQSVDGAEGASHGSEADWEFTTKKPWDRDAIPFNPDVLAPVGYVFIGGKEAQTKKKLLQAIRVASPVVILDNTPNVPKQVSLLVNVVKKVWERAPLLGCGPYLNSGARSKLGANPSSADLIEAMLPSKIMNHVEQEFDSGGMEESEKLTLSDIVGLMDIIKRRPQTFKETVCVVDPLHHVPDHIMSQLVSVLSSHHTGARELQTTAIHRSLVMKAWRLHRKLACRAQQLRTAVTTLVVIVALVMVLSTTLAVWMVSIRLERARVNDVTYNMSAPVWTEEIEISFTIMDELGFLKVCLLVLPMIAGLLTTLQSHFHINQKWASVHMGATLTVGEIYHFLGCIAPYNSSASTNQRRFMTRLQGIVKQLSIHGIHEEDLMGGSGDSGDEFPEDSEALEEHINQHLYGVRPQSWCLRKLQDLMALMGSAAPSCAWAALLLEGQEAKDFCAHITAEQYMEMRILPLRKYYSNLVRYYSTVRTALNVVMVLCLSVGAGLGASGFSLWIPVSLALATFVTTTMHWLAPTEFLTAVSNAMTTLNNIDLRWQGSDIREHRSEATRSHVISTTEKLCAAVAITCSAAACVFEELDDDTFDEPSNNKLSEKRIAVSRHSNVSSQAVTPYGRSGSQTPMKY